MVSKCRKTLVLGVGNELLQDEGLGIHAVRLLQSYDLTPEVEVIEGGTAGEYYLGAGTFPGDPESFAQVHGFSLSRTNRP